MIGGKEVEILGTVSSDDFSSGKCFQRGYGSPAVPSSQAARKCFSNPFKSVCQSGQSKENRRSDWQNCKPRHDPHTPSKIVKITRAFCVHCPEILSCKLCLSFVLKFAKVEVRPGLHSELKTGLNYILRPVSKPKTK